MVYISLYLVFSILGLTLIKLGGDKFSWVIHFFKTDIKIGIVSIFGLISYALSFLIYSFILIPRYELSYITALITGVTQLLILIVAVLVFKEHVNAVKLIGICLIVIGVIMLNIRK